MVEILLLNVRVSKYHNVRTHMLLMLVALCLFDRLLWPEYDGLRAHRVYNLLLYRGWVLLPTSHLNHLQQQVAGLYALVKTREMFYWWHPAEVIFQ